MKTCWNDLAISYAHTHFACCMGVFTEYPEYDGLGLAELVSKKAVSAEEVLEAAIARIERLNPQLNAVVHRMYDEAKGVLKQIPVDAPFRGVPFLLKDMLAAYAGQPMHGGSRLTRENVPNYNSTVTLLFKNSGLAILGKTSTPEFGLTVTSESELYGPAYNPWDLSRTTGGSSGGSASAVASRMVPMAHGNDGGGSIRVPASCCGVIGLKPTRGRVPIGPEGEAWYGYVAEGVLTRTVRDCAGLLDALTRSNPGWTYCMPAPVEPYLKELEKPVSPLRIAYSAVPLLGRNVDPVCVAGLENTVRLLKDLGHELVKDTPPVERTAFARAFFSMVCIETRAMLQAAGAARGRRPSRRDVELSTWIMGLLGREFRGVDLSKILHTLHAVSWRIGEFLSDYDVFLSPSIAMPPPKIGALQPRQSMSPVQFAAVRAAARLNAGGLLMKSGGVDQAAERVFEFAPFSAVFNVSGHPALTLPLYWTDQSLPIGMQFVGRYADEATVLRLAAQLEEACPWQRKIPAICR